MTQEQLKEMISTLLNDGVRFPEENSDMMIVEVDASKLQDLIYYLKNNLGFNFLVDICGIHYPDQENELGAVYQLLNMESNERIRIKVFVSKKNPDIPSLCEIFSGANWMERETYDFYGINFVGHPNLKRILNVDYLDYFPMRKEYPLEDPTREDKDNSFFGR